MLSRKFNAVMVIVGTVILLDKYNKVKEDNEAVDTKFKVKLKK